MITTPQPNPTLDSESPDSGRATAPAAPPTGDTARELQRFALRDLVALSTESAATETRIEQERAQAEATATSEFEKAKFSVRERHKAAEEATRRKHAEAVARVEADYQAELRKVEQEAAGGLRTIDSESEPTLRRLNQKHDEEIWMADSVLEVAKNTLREEQKKAAAEYQTRLKELDQYREKADVLLADYRVKPPVSAKVIVPSAPALQQPSGDQSDAGNGAADVGADATGENQIAPVPAAGPRPSRTFEQARGSADERLHHLGSLRLAGLFAGIFPYFLLVVLVIGAAAAGQLIQGGLQLPTSAAAIQWTSIGAFAGGMFVVGLVLAFLLHNRAKSQVLNTYRPLLADIDEARLAAKFEMDEAEATRQAEYAKAIRRRDRESREAAQRVAPLREKAVVKRDAATKAVKSRRDSEVARVTADRKRRKAEADEWLKKTLTDVTEKHKSELREKKTRTEAFLLETRRKYAQTRAELEKRLSDGLRDIGVTAHSTSVNSAQDGNGDGHPAPAEKALPSPAPAAWDDPAWNAWIPPRVFSPLVPFGQIHVDLRSMAQANAAMAEKAALAAAVAARAKRTEDEDDDEQDEEAAAAKTLEEAKASIVKPTLAMPAPFDVPANFSFPRGGSLLIETDRDGRDEAIRILQAAMTRLLTWLPAGRVRFNIIDPIGLGQTFAGFMHLADYDEALVGGRILTESEQIDKRLTDMTEHMETVIQKYLRNEFATIDDYNAQAGELSEPYRFLVIADFPASFSVDAMRRLSSIALTGPRCGVYTLVVRDTRTALPSEGRMDELQTASVYLARQVTSAPNPNEWVPPGTPAKAEIPAWQEGKFVWMDDVFRQFPLTLDSPPTEEQLTRIAHRVGKGAKEAARVEVNFDTIAPKPEQFWTESSADELVVAVGRRGATRLQNLRLGKGVAQHVITAGKTGSGKSTLLHALVSNLAMWYSPDEVEFYLIDFKKGVEFKTYATERLPHARAIAVESDREFGLSVLQRLDAELSRRGDLFRKAGTQNIGDYRRSPSPLPMPRTLLLIDEFQEFFSEDDKLAAEASLLIDRLVRQGRAFGMHVFLGSQTIGGSSGINRATIGQMAVRIALMTSEADSQIILGDGNSAARLLTRPGEAIYNDQGGLVEANSPFQVAWLSDERREQYLRVVRQKYDSSTTVTRREDPIVFEGNAAADATLNKPLRALLEAGRWPVNPLIRGWLGDPVAIKDPSAVIFRHNTGSNVLLIGQQDEEAMGILAISMVSLAATHPPKEAIFYVVETTPGDSPVAGVLDSVRNAIPHRSSSVAFRAVPELMEQLTEEVQRRVSKGTESGGDGSAITGPEIYVVIYGLQRYKSLRKSEDSFGGGFGAEEKKVDPGKLFADLLRDGPPVGVHVLAWCDTPIAVERTLDRASMREFDNRILFQMSANDSSNLIDSPVANKLGFHRALAYSEEQGTFEKFRPYGVPSKDWLQWVKEKLCSRPGAGDIADELPPPTRAVASSSDSGGDEPNIPDFLKAPLKSEDSRFDDMKFEDLGISEDDLGGDPPADASK